VSISRLREYLAYEFKDMAISFPFDIERVVDDFVFMNFFIGNDFLPHLPSLRVREGAIDLMYMIYKHCLPQIDGYLTEGRKLQLKRVDFFFNKLSLVEGELFMLRKRQEQTQKAKDEY
jgi:5'-3' exonuclease